MKMFTKKMENRFTEVGSQDGKGDDAVVIAKFFTPYSNWAWYVTEYDPDTGLYFGYVSGLDEELGYFSRAELEGLAKSRPPKIERDMYWTECTVGDVKRGLA